MSGKTTETKWYRLKRLADSGDASAIQRLARKKEKGREYYKAYMERLKQSPERLEAFLEKNSQKASKRMRKIRENAGKDPRAAAVVERHNRSSVLWMAELRMKASEGDPDALASLIRYREKRKLAEAEKYKRIKSLAAAGDPEQVARLEKMRDRSAAAGRKRRQRLLGDPAALAIDKAKMKRYQKRLHLRKKYEAVLANPAVADAAELNRARAWQRARLIASDPVLSEKRNKAAAKHRDEHREEAVKRNVEWRRNNRELYNALKLMRKRKARARLRAKPQAPNVCAELAMLGINFGALEEQQDGQS